MTPHTLIGIDPGTTGAIAICTNYHSFSDKYTLFKMPDTRIGTRDAIFDFITMNCLTDGPDPYDGVICWIEKAQGGIFNTGGRIDPEKAYYDWVKTLPPSWCQPTAKKGVAYGVKIALAGRPSAHGTFKYGKGYGELLGIIEGMGIELIEKRPHDWMKALGKMPHEKDDRKNHIRDLMKAEYGPKGVKVHKYSADAMGILHVMMQHYQPEVVF